jgi:hypothetical protein
MGWMINAKSRPLYPREWHGTNCIGGWVGPRTPRPLWTGTENLASTGIRSPDRPACSESPTDLFYKSEWKAHKILAILSYPFSKWWFLQHRFSRKLWLLKELCGCVLYRIPPKQVYRYGQYSNKFICLTEQAGVAEAEDVVESLPGKCLLISFIGTKPVLSKLFPIHRSVRRPNLNAVQPNTLTVSWQNSCW